MSASKTESGRKSRKADEHSPKHLETLAERLIVRHVRTSVPDLDIRTGLTAITGPTPDLERKLRCVALVGAGASAPLLKRGDDLATQLEARFVPNEEARKAELFRLERIYGLDRTHFETRLAALSRTPEATHAVRHAIADSYSARHPTLLGYELLAHLIKHRFLDGIVSFNFDELLDQSLDDELGRDEYVRVVSERDCVGLVTDADAANYLPLYIKLHGTATEPDSLRFTRDAYYELPRRLQDTVGELLAADLCVVVNVGFGMAGFDLHRLLRIPREIEIYDLSLHALSESVCTEIRDERSRPREDSYYPDTPRQPPVFRLFARSRKKGAKRTPSDEWLRKLAGEIEQLCGSNAKPATIGSVVQFRSAKRHEVVARFLGPTATDSRWIGQQGPSPEYISYLRRRTILELAFAAAKARGLGQLASFAVDRCGDYYDLYRHHAGSGGDPWPALREAAGMEENGTIPDVVEATARLCEDDPRHHAQGPSEWSLRKFDAEAFARHVLSQLGSSPTRANLRPLAEAIDNLQNSSEVEIHGKDDRVCGKAFERPILLATVTSLSAYTWMMMRNLAPGDRIFLSSETGEWLLGERVHELLRRQEQIELLAAFDFKLNELGDLYGDRLKVRIMGPWRHNRHMTIVCNGETPVRAVYFARRLRTPYITPVYLPQHADARRLKRLYDLLWSGQ